MTNAVQWQEWPENGPGEEYYDCLILCWHDGDAVIAEWDLQWRTADTYPWHYIDDDGVFDGIQITHFAAITPPEDAA